MLMIHKKIWLKIKIKKVKDKEKLPWQDISQPLFIKLTQHFPNITHLTEQHFTTPTHLTGTTFPKPPSILPERISRSQVVQAPERDQPVVRGSRFDRRGNRTTQTPASW